jgi:sulfite exporter TauE/SafE/copper chaperone CopZ
MKMHFHIPSLLIIMSQEHIYSVKGMHCAACEVLIEKKLLEIPGVKAVDASTADGKAIIEYEGEKPNIATLNNIFQKDNYTFSDSQFVGKENVSENSGKGNPMLFGLAIAAVIIMAFLLLDKLGISGLFNISSKSSLVSFFGFGILAGLSSCAALVGGIVLSLSKQWLKMYSSETSEYKKFQPHLMFNVGRILSYAVLGGLLGLLGSRLSISFSFTSFLVTVISLLMIVLALQMLGVRGFRRFQLSMPKFITRKIADEQNFKGKHMPFAMGALTFFIPCGFTITTQTIALLSSSALQGSLIMGFFALGTAPMLLLIGLSSVKFSSRPHWANIFSKVAGFIVLFFALYNITNQMSILGFGI